METFEQLNVFYSDHCDEDARLASRHGQVEYLTTQHYLHKYLQPGMRILEIGAGTGRYSHSLAREGYTVDAVELIPHNIEVFKQNTQPDEAITITQGNALDLSFITSETYAITLLLGPMYHLFTVEDQHQALAEAIRVTKKGGVIFAAYCNNDATLLQFAFGKGQILHEPYRSLIDPVTFKAASTPKELFQLYRKEDIDALMAGFPVTRLHYLGTDMAANFMKDAVDAMSDEVFDLFMRYHLSICERPDMVGATHHMLDIFRRNA